MSEYEKVLIKTREECQVSLQIQRTVAATAISFLQRGGMDFTDSHASALTDERLSLSALFRYCLACSLRDKAPVFDRIADNYSIAAAVQFEPSRKEYVGTWKGWLPEDFVETASRVYNRFVTGVDSHGDEEA